MTAHYVLMAFLIMRLAQHFIETSLARLNFSYWNDPVKQEAARIELGISTEDMLKSADYSRAKYQFSRFRNSVSTLVLIAFVGFGGLGMIEAWAIKGAQALGYGSIVTGVLFFAILMLLAQVLGLPFAVYNTFVIEERFGFNKQTPRGFMVDLLKGLVISAVLGGPLIAAILWIMERAGNNWWVWAWLILLVYLAKKELSCLTL